jgi:hypothetical protein
LAKPFSDYTWADWKRLRPITHRLKTARYGLVDRRYRSKPAAVGDAAAVAKAIAGRRALFTVGFEDAEAIAWQTLLVRHFVPGAVHVVVDNSPGDADAKAIERAAAEHGVPYLRAPDNPWQGASRSHGIVLNWIWHNIVRLGGPEAFGLLDDDLFPTAPDDPFAPLARQDIYGYVRFAEPPYPRERWFLWAGFTMMRFSAVRDLPLDFGQDWFIGLDTGGGNWRPLYSRLDLRTLEHAPSRFVPYREGLEWKEAPLQWCGTWLHEVGQMGQPELMADKRRVVAGILAPHLAAARAALTPNSIP